MSDQEFQQIHAVVEGYVQGVGFRFFVQENALRLGLTGWVRNRWDGSVEVMAEGSRETLEKLLAALYRGPRSATVTDVTLEWGPATHEFSHFQVKMTSS